MQRRRPHEQATFLRRRRREASRALALLVCLVLAQRAQALPLMDRFVQNVFEPDRLNRWFTLWEKVIHLARFHVHNIPRIIMMPFSNIHTMHGRAKDIRRGLSDVPLRSLLACHGASASTVDDEEGRSLLSFSPSALKKRLGGGLRPTGRSYFDAEDILLFMLGLGLASMLGLATFMAPFTSILATGLTPVTVQGNVAPAAATAAVTHGRRRRRSSSWTDGTYAAELLHAMEEAREQYKKPL
ncbi:hypothetical protein MTO96_031000 [Rhipicephalus appendiculatus]